MRNIVAYLWPNTINFDDCRFEEAVADPEGGATGARPL